MITCADRVLMLASSIGQKDEMCCAVHKRRCIDVPPNECRMKPIDGDTRDPIERKFTFKKEGINARWWEDE